MTILDVVLAECPSLDESTLISTRCPAEFGFGLREDSCERYAGDCEYCWSRDAAAERRPYVRPVVHDLSMSVIDFLKQPLKIDIQIRNKLIERQQYKDIALGITASTEGGRVSSSGSKSKMADAVNRLVDTEKEIDALIDKLIATRQDVIHTIEQVDNPTWYNILHMRYVQYKEITEIGDHYRKPYDWAKTNLHRARDEVQRIREKK